MAEATHKRPPVSNLTQRLITAVIAIPPVVALITIGGLPFKLLIGFFGAVAILELFVILQRRLILFFLFVPYVIVPLTFLVLLRDSERGLIWMWLIIAMTWATDILSYVGGRLFGRTPLWLRISPKKTLEGAITGYVSGFLAALLTLILTETLSIPRLLLPILGPLIAIMGDLFESYLKRLSHTKDSHLLGLNILPGHGGILDRIDGLLFVCVFCFVFNAVIGI